MVNKICDPESAKFNSEATSWGCNQEKTALKLYEVGFRINPEYPFLGATIDEELFQTVPV